MNKCHKDLEFNGKNKVFLVEIFKEILKYGKILINSQLNIIIKIKLVILNG
jgi:hypothetical protein